METIKLSFIVPVYNVAPYLRKCVDSLLAQDYDDYEIILVDDGSTDESSAICDEYAASSLSAAGTSPFSEADHSIIPIRVIHQPNAGLSAARNAGLKIAKGEYICFVDSDDYWQPNVLSGLMAQVERDNLDVLRFDYQNVRLTPNGAYEVFEPNKTPRYIDHKNEIVNGETYLNTRMGYACYAVMFILRRDLILPTRVNKKDSFPLRVKSFAQSNVQRTLVEQNGVGLLFTPGIHFEDVDWLPRMMLCAQRVNSTQTTVYNYFVRQGSITKTQGNKAKIRKNIEDSMSIIETYSAYIERYPACRWLKNMQSSMIASVLMTVAQSLYSERKEYISRLKAFNVFPLSIADQGRTYKRRAMLINISPRLAVLILHFKKMIS